MPRNAPPRKDKNRVPRRERALPAAPKKDAERVAKVIARAGLGSRREIEAWITEGRVAVNGEVLATPAVTVTAEDRITVDGAPLPERERTRLFLYHKPRGVVTTNRDPEGRTTLFEILPAGLPRLVSVGRLDLNSEGLLLLTNDGGLARVLELPETGWLRRYRVRANGAVDQAKLDTLIRGITVEGVEYGPIEAVLDRVQGANAWITVSLREGKNREVRVVLAALGLTVNRLIRISYGPFQLGDIPEGAVEEVRTRILRDQIGDEIAAASGADFEAPLYEHEAEEPAPRPHASTRTKADTPARPLRSRRAAQEETAEPRPRLRGRRADPERELEALGTVADRKGRTIKVDRVVAKREEPAGPRRGARAADRPGAEGRFGRPRRADEGEAPRRGKPFGAGRPRDDVDRPERPARGRRPAPGEGQGDFERSERSPRRADRSGYEDGAGGRARRAGPGRPERGGDERPFSRADRPASSRPARSYADKPIRGGRARPEGEGQNEGHGRPRPAGRKAGFAGKAERRGPGEGPTVEGRPHRRFRTDGPAGRNDQDFGGGRNSAGRSGSGRSFAEKGGGRSFKGAAERGASRDDTGTGPRGGFKAGGTRSAGPRSGGPKFDGSRSDGPRAAGAKPGGRKGAGSKGPGSRGAAGTAPGGKPFGGKPSGGGRGPGGGRPSGGRPAPRGKR